MDHSARHAAATAPPSANISLFLKNLRLLDLDLSSDWPGITLQTFSHKDANQKLRQRVKGVEWTLYHLFAIWDRDETNNKLRPFFPPLEPLQSVNLRAALFRCLTDLKKNGVLGKEVTLRKTMLDECKGDKFEEMLASFSTVVLRKEAAQASRTAPAKNLALSPSLSKSDQHLLVPLILAHRASIAKGLREKTERKHSYDELWKLLDLKELELRQRSKALKKPEIVSNTHVGNASGRLREIVTDQWTGDPRWAELIVNGVQERPGDELLQLPFDMFLDRTLGGAGPDLDTPKVSNVLNEMNAQIAEQEDRLQNWKDFYSTLQWSKEGADPKENSVPAKAPVLLFQDHQDLTLEVDCQGRITAGAVESVQENAEYDSIIGSMHQELAKFKDGGSLREQKPARYDYTISKRDQKSATLAAVKTQEDSHAPIMDLPTSHHLSDKGAGSHASSGQMSYDPSLKRSDDEGFSDDGEPLFKDYLPDDSSNQTMKPPEARPLPNPPSPSAVSSSPARTTLLERTRQSMSLLPDSNTRSHPSHPSKATKPPRPSSSAFPVNPFETPQKKLQNKSRRYSTDSELPLGSSGTSTPRDELFSQEADYASVFKSRPRVVVSPNVSPTLRWRG